MHIIGIGGFRRSGKDTFARVVAEEARKRGFAVAIIAFADPLRQAAAAAYGVDIAAFTDDACKDTVCEAWGITYRQMLNNLGKAMRGFDEDHWVKAWRRAVTLRSRRCKYGEAPDLPVIVLVPDLRRVNEARAIHKAGGLTVLMRRPGIVWDGHENEMPAHLAQHRDDLKAASLGCAYAVDDLLSLHYPTPGLPWRRVYDRAIDNAGMPEDLRAVAQALVNGLGAHNGL